MGLQGHLALSPPSQIFNILFNMNILEKQRLNPLLVVFIYFDFFFN